MRQIAAIPRGPRTPPHVRARGGVQSPMNPARNRSVWRYFLPADAFVRIRISTGSADVRPRLRSRSR